SKCQDGTLTNLCFIVLQFSYLIFSVSAPCSLKSNSSCDECLQNVACLWCSSTQQCMDYPVKNILPPSSVCPLNDARWGVCWVNFQILIITMSVLAGVIIIAILVCCFCCCKCQRIGCPSCLPFNSLSLIFSPFRKTEIQLRHDEIRQKYGETYSFDDGIWKYQLGILGYSKLLMCCF
uniref:PSI domain-containing protein n=1 Tax=Xiphophorus couchianus TaxID=32473 RepID=A0A3B5L0F3_9TELE